MPVTKQEIHLDTEPQPTPRSNPDMIPQPLVLTLRLDKATEKLLTALRTTYFPRHRNFLPAHVTLFHALPASSQSSYKSILAQLSESTAPFTVGVKTPFPLGKKGVGINIASHKLREMHARLLEDFRIDGVELTEQDGRKLSPHVTVQNKVGEEEAIQCLRDIKEHWRDTAGKAEGVVVWRYEIGGRWTFLKEFEFMGKEGDK